VSQFGGGGWGFGLICCKLSCLSEFAALIIASLWFSPPIPWLQEVNSTCSQHCLSITCTRDLLAVFRYIVLMALRPLWSTPQRVLMARHVDLGYIVVRHNFMENPANVLEICKWNTGATVIDHRCADGRFLQSTRGVTKLNSHSVSSSEKVLEMGWKAGKHTYSRASDNEVTW
jgi:hypothetical protein